MTVKDKNESVWIENRAFAFLDLVMTTFLMGLGIFVGSVTIHATTKIVSHNEIKGKVFDLRRFFSAALDCQRTFQNQDAICASGGFIPLYDKKGSLITTSVEPYEQYIDQMSLRAKCESDVEGKYLKVEFAVGSDATGTNFKNDPQFRRPLAWQPLFQQKVRCAQALSPSVAPNYDLKPYVVKYGLAVARYFDYVTVPTPLTAQTIGVSMTLTPYQVNTTCQRLGFSGVKGPLPEGSTYSSPSDNAFIDWDSNGTAIYTRNADIAGNQTHLSFPAFTCE